jgi:hypothetical protein
VVQSSKYVIHKAPALQANIHAPSGGINCYFFGQFLKQLYRNLE